MVEVFSVHRLGHLKFGEISAMVVVGADHRDEAIEACKYVISEVKARVSARKKEYYTDGGGVYLNRAKWLSALGSIANH